MGNIKFEDGEVWTEERLGNSNQWSATAERVSTLHGVIFKAEQLAAAAFLADDTELARAFKSFAADLKQDLIRAQGKLQEFLNAASTERVKRYKLE